MTDVRLTATNPADSSVVPVAANSKGELLVAEPTVTDINNDVTINGDLTVTGTINGDTGGSGLPEPYGPDGSVLSIENGEPAWTGVDLLCKDYVPPVPPPPVELVDNSVSSNGTSGLYDASGQKITLAEGWDEYCKALPNYGTSTPQWVKQGIGKDGLGDLSWDLELRDVFGKVITIGLYGEFQLYNASNNSSNSFTWYMSASNENIQQVTGNGGISGRPNETYKLYTEWSWLCNRGDLGPVNFRVLFNSTNFLANGTQYCCINKWEVEDAGTFAVRNQIKVADKLEKLAKQLEVIPSTDIDLLR